MEKGHEIGRESTKQALCGELWSTEGTRGRQATPDTRKCVPNSEIVGKVAEVARNRPRINERSTVNIAASKGANERPTNHARSLQKEGTESWTNQGVQVQVALCIIVV